MSQLTKYIATSGPGSGTVTSVSGANGINITGVATVNPTVNLDIPVTIAHGGTNAIAFGTVDGTVYYDGTSLVTTATGNAGDILTSNGPGLAPSYQPSVADGIITANGDTGSATGATVTWDANTNCGKSVVFDANVATVSLKVTDADNNTTIGLNSGLALAGGTDNTALGSGSGISVTTGDLNVIIGSAAGVSIDTGSNNTIVGSAAAASLVSGSDNVIIGRAAGSAYTGAEGNNILIDNTGVIADAGLIRIGTNGVHTETHIAGIDGVDNSTAEVVTMGASDKLGSSVITAGTNVTVTAGVNTITIAANASAVTYNYVSVNNAASPYTALATDYYVSADVTAGVVTIRLPNAPTTGRTFVVKDQVGLAATNNITVTTVGGAVNIDGATSFIMNTAYESISLIFNGSTYEVF